VTIVDHDRINNDSMIKSSEGRTDCRDVIEISENTEQLISTQKMVRSLSSPYNQSDNLSSRSIKRLTWVRSSIAIRRISVELSQHSKTVK
jgi:hypothetical protein